VLTDERDIAHRAGKTPPFLGNHAEGELIAEERRRLCATIDAIVRRGS
jgi:hypothetical protein